MKMTDLKQVVMNPASIPTCIRVIEPTPHNNKLSNTIIKYKGPFAQIPDELMDEDTALIEYKDMLYITIDRCSQ